VESVIRAYEAEPAPFAAKGLAAASYISERYSPSLEEQEVMSAWQAIIASHSTLR
jgi:hypothetical protein